MTSKVYCVMYSINATCVSVINDILLDSRKAPPSPDQLISGGSSLSSLDDSKTTSPSDKPLSARVDLLWERAILSKSSLLSTTFSREAVYA